MATTPQAVSPSTDRCEFGLFYNWDSERRENVPSVVRRCDNPRHVRTSSTRYGLYDHWACEHCGATGSIDTGHGD